MYIYVAVRRFCAVSCLIIICFSLLFSNYSTYVFLIFLLCLFYCFVYLFYILCILCFCNVLCTVSPFVYRCLFPIFVQVYPPLPPDENPTAVHKYHIMYVSFLILSSNTSLYLLQRTIYTLVFAPCSSLQLVFTLF